MTTYKDAGVDVNAGYKAVSLMKKHVKRTMLPEVLTDIGSFGGAFALNLNGYKEPVLVSGTDGVGTKLKIAFLMDKHDTVGIDCVAMCVNDIVCSGAKPLFFLDYIATGKLIPEKVEKIVKGISEGCLQAGCALIGGETAEMPDFYADGEYDMAGFAVGIADREKMIDSSCIRARDKIIGFASSGIHSNGYSLVRKVLDISKENLTRYNEMLGTALGDELLKPTRIYVKSVLKIMEKFQINGIANITGGGFIENIPRAIPDGLCAKIYTNTWSIPPVFKMISDLGRVCEEDMYNTFNMGIGMVVIVSPDIADSVLKCAESAGERAYIIGEIEENTDKKIIIL